MFSGNGSCHLRLKIGVEPLGFVAVAAMANLLLNECASETVSLLTRDCRID